MPMHTDVCESIFMCADVHVHAWELSHPDAVKMVKDPNSEEDWEKMLMPVRELADVAMLEGW